MPFAMKSSVLGISKSAFAAALLVLSWSAYAPNALAAGIFAPMDGDWQGDGSITWYSGETERLRCKAANDVTDDGNKIEQTLTCANPSLGEPWKIKTSLSYRSAAGVVIGTWNESKYGMKGNITGPASGSKIDARVRPVGSNNVSVRVLVTTSDGQQVVVLKVQTPEGLTEISVTMRKA